MQTTRQARPQAATHAVTAGPGAAQASTLQSRVTPQAPAVTFGQRASAAGATLLTVVCLLGGVLGLAEQYTDTSPAGAVLAVKPNSNDRSAG